METYIRKKINGFYIDFINEIDPEYWAGKIGTTYEDFEADKWIHLSAEQVAFHNEYPTASVLQVITMTPPEPYVRTLEDAKYEKLLDIKNYDQSSFVNSFNVTINGEESQAWLTPTERSDYSTSIEAAELTGISELQMYINKVPVTLSINDAKLMLALIQLYANECFRVTKQHKNNVESLDIIEDVDNYDYTAGYPEKLSFQLD